MRTLRVVLRVGLGSEPRVNSISNPPEDTNVSIQNKLSDTAIKTLKARPAGTTSVIKTLYLSDFPSSEGYLPIGNAFDTFFGDAA